MNTKEIRIENISEAYCVYKSLINDKCLCQNNQEILSVLAIQTDAFSLTIILKFFNKYTDLSKNIGNNDDIQTVENLLNICPLHIKRLCKNLVAKHRNVLNINPSKVRLKYYSFLKWVQE